MQVCDVTLKLSTCVDLFCLFLSSIQFLFSFAIIPTKYICKLFIQKCQIVFCEITVNSILYWSWKSFWIFIEPRDWNSEKVNMNLEQQPIILDSFKTFRLKRSFDWNAFYVFWSKDRNQNKISLFEKPMSEHKKTHSKDPIALNQNKVNQKSHCQKRFHFITSSHPVLNFNFSRKKIHSFKQYFFRIILLSNKTSLEQYFFLTLFL